MNPSSYFRRVAILGPGLLGGSLALAVKQFLPDCEVRLWGRRAEPLKLAEELHAADLCTTDIAAAVSGADLVVIASPIGVMRTIAESFLPYVQSGVLVTDVGSVKGSVHQDLGAYLRENGIDFIGSHPMAGSEKQGIEHASDSLFQNACVVLTNGEGVNGDKFARLCGFWTSLGSECVELDADAHDRLVARVSHFPHATAALCVNAACSGIDLAEAAMLASSGFRDTTRVAAGAPAMWAEILLENRAALIESLNHASEQISLLRQMLGSGDRQALEEWLLAAKTSRQVVVRKGSRKNPRKDA